MYFSKTPEWIIKVFPGITWRIPEEKPTIYLTFDDGPHPKATDFVLNQLNKYGANASFFLIGKNVEKYPETARLILEENHCIGNHTYNHVNGWNTPLDVYMNEVGKGKEVIENHLGISPLWFRPPYGKLTFGQMKAVKEKHTIAMMDILCGDFDVTKTGEFCSKNILKNYRNGSIIVYHDSEKAFARMTESLPDILRFCQEKGIECKALPTIL